MKDNVVKTEYGYELIWAKLDSYCGKILVFEKPQSRLALHFHKQKNKSWFVNTGKFKVQWIDTKDGKSYAQELVEGSVFHIPALMPVSLESLLPNSAVAETSDAEVDNDLFKLS